MYTSVYAEKQGFLFGISCQLSAVSCHCQLSDKEEVLTLPGVRGAALAILSGGLHTGDAPPAIIKLIPPAFRL
jgi:hypothetical protein